MEIENDYFSQLRVEYQKENFESFLRNRQFVFSVKAIHIAGSNGKGSVANYLANVYQCAGYKVGLFTSPYLNDVTEMISINGTNISNEDLFAYIEKNKDEFAMFDLSQFEVLTFIAFNYFMDQGCDLAIIECGMGGELDATNIFTPIMSVITSVSIEHTTYLGNSLTDIAIQKGGIIKEKVPTVIGKLPEEALLVLKNIAIQKHTKLIQTVDAFDLEIHPFGASFSYANYAILQIKNPAVYSINDACIAVEVVKNLSDILPYSSSDLFKGLLSTEVPCRNEKISEKPIVILDGAHNPEGIIKLIESLEAIYPGANFHVIFASFKDKNINSMLTSLSSLTNDITLTSFKHQRCRNKDDYFLYLEEHPFIENHIEAIKRKMKQCPDDIILITGSLAFVGVVRKEFHDGKYQK